MPRTTRHHGALIALLLLTLVWSYNWIVMKQVLAYSGPFEFAALRYVLGTLVLFVVLAARGESLRLPPLAPIVVIGLAQTTGFQALVQWALVGGGAGRTALLAYTMPFWVVLLAWGLYADRPTPRQWTSIAIAAAGLLLVLEPWRGLGGSQSAALAIGGGACWAIGTVVSKRMFARGGVTPLQLTAWQMAAGTVGLVAISVAVPERPIAWSPYFVYALAYNALLSSGIAWALWALVVERLPMNVAGLSSLAIPVAGVLFAWALLGERPSLPEALGIVLIGAALAAINARRKTS